MRYAIAGFLVFVACACALHFGWWLSVQPPMNPLGPAH